MTETLVVIIFVAVIFTFLYISIIPLIGTYNDKVVRESNIDIVYKLYHIRKMIYNDKNNFNITTGNVNEVNCSDINNANCNNLMEALELSNYTLLYVNGIKNNVDTLSTNYNKIYQLIENDLENEEEVLMLYDNERNTFAYLKYDDSSLFGDIAYKKVLKDIPKHEMGSCTNLKYEEDGITYISGSRECIDFNYVWYSGKLWRITAIYPDGAIKMITENSITSIAFNERYKSAFNNSYVYKWLNEEFYDTLYNASNFIDTTKTWDATQTSSYNTKPDGTTIVSSNIGLLNSYEYKNSIRGVSGDEGYLNIGYYWWLLNSASFSLVRCVRNNGSPQSETSTTELGVRPSIYLKSGIEFNGSGTRENPYIIVGEKNIGRENEYINTRISGEYIKLKNGNNEQVFRIIGVDNNKTKIIAMDYADNKATKSFATSTGTDDTLWGSGTTTDTGTWYTYLNSIYYPNLVSTYGNIFDSGTYYLGTSGYDYKLSICANTTSGNTQICDKTSDKGIFDIGLPRYGEILATQEAEGYSNSINMWLMNRFSASNSVLYVDYFGRTSSNAVTTTNGARPTLYLKSTVKILSGSGTKSDPYVVGL